MFLRIISSVALFDFVSSIVSGGATFWSFFESSRRARSRPSPPDLPSSPLLAVGFFSLDSLSGAASCWTLPTVGMSFAGSGGGSGSGA